MKKLIFLILLPFMGTLIQAQSFSDVSTNLGIAHSYGNGARFGGGVSFCDFNQDGWDDLTIATQSGDSILFYENTGGSFQKVSFPSIDDTSQIKQVLWIDYDNDGDKDFFTTANRSENYLYTNDGSFNFSAYEFPAPDTFNALDYPTYGATFTDINKDGYLDVFICNYKGNLAIPNQLFLNNGDGSFTDVTYGSFIADYYQTTFCVVSLDYNNDGNPDLYTAEDRTTINRLYEGWGNGYLQDVSDGCGADVTINAMGLAVGDYDGDYDLDIYVANTPEGNPLLRNNGDGSFSQVDSAAGVTFNRVSWGVNFFDYDCDTDLDLYVSTSTDLDALESNLFQNQSDGTFLDAPNDGFLGDSTMSFCNAIGDYNNDGFPDIAVANLTPDSFQLWQNSTNANNWIKIELEGTVSNRDGIDSWVEVYVAGQKYVRYTQNGLSYLAQNSESTMIGLGTASQADSIVVRWLSGIVDVLGPTPAGQTVTIVEGQTINSISAIHDASLDVYPNPFENQLAILFEANTPSEISIELYDQLGRKVYSQNLSNPSKHTRIELPDLATGNYTLRLSTATEILTKKLIRQ